MSAFDKMEDLVSANLSRNELDQFLAKVIDNWQVVASVQEFLGQPDVFPSIGNFSHTDHGVSLAEAAANLATGVDLLGRGLSPSFKREFGPFPMQFKGFGTNTALLFEKLADSRSTNDGRKRLAEYLVEVFSCLSDNPSQNFSVFGADQYGDKPFSNSSSRDPHPLF